MALDALAGPAFADAFNGSTDQSTYRWGRLHRIVLTHPLGGSFSIPPAGGAFPQPLPGLPGISVDGGLHTVDPGTHPISRDNANGFMFTFAPALRYVASMEGDAIKAVSSLPGGQSGVPGSRFYLNLLGRWLTNDVFPLRPGALNARPPGAEEDQRQH
jgi:penicillin amidase